MDIWSWLQEVAILIVVCRTTAAETDLLESLRPKEENPPDLNEFLTNFWGLKKDFNLVRLAARKYSKMKKDTQAVGLYDPVEYFGDSYNDFNNYKIDHKRHVHHGNNNGNRKFRNLGLLPPNMRNKFHRIRRGTQNNFEEQMEGNSRNIQKRFPGIIMLQGADEDVQKPMPSPGESKIEKHIPSQIFLDTQPEKIQKRTPEDISVQTDGETGRILIHDGTRKSPKIKKQAIDLDDEIHGHKAYKNHPERMRMDMKGNKQNDAYYVDLGDASQREQDRYNDRRAYNSPRQDYDYHAGPMYHRPHMGPRPRPRPSPNFEYPQYDNKMHHSSNDEIAFEKALSYEIEPRYGEGPEGSNNPDGNNLVSVDAGRADRIQPFNPQEGYQSRIQDGYEYAPQATTNERFFIDADKSVTRQETTPPSTTSASSGNNVSPSSDNSGQKNIKHVGSGFIEITKSRRDNEKQLENHENPLLAKKSLTLLDAENIGDKEAEQSDRNVDRSKEASSILSKHSLHPLRVKDTHRDEEELDEEQDDSGHSSEQRNVKEENEMEEQDDSVDIPEERVIKENEKREAHFQARKLKFIDYESADSYNREENYEEMPHRPRRDFLDALGMRNEEDYTEDNPYKDEQNVNNTDVHNDTHIQDHTTKHHSCHKTSTCRPVGSHQKTAFKNIKQILEEPKEITGVPTYGDIKMKKNDNEKRPKKSLPQEDSFDDRIEDGEVRRAREANSEMETKIMENKEKIYNAHEDDRRANPENVQLTQDNMGTKWNEDQSKLNEMKKYVPIQHRIDKKQDNEVTEGTELIESTEAAETTEVTDVKELTDMTTPVANCTETTTMEVNAAYEQMAHHMDVENEKLAQVVNGHLATKIVSTVFDALRTRTSLKSKFYSGLSRKHVDFAGTFDCDIFKTNQTDDVDEARLLLDQITKVLNKLVMNQVRRKLCQRLPEELKQYLDLLLNVKNTMDASNYSPNQQQGDFLFTYQDKNEPPFDVEKLQEVLVKLEGLLLSFHNMNEDSQNRASPLKDYIEKHVKMLKQIVSCPGGNCDEKFSETKRDTPIFKGGLFERQMESVGLGKNQEFIPNFDLSEMVRRKMKANRLKNEKKREAQKNSFKSQQFRKLQLAAERVRDKRENEKKIGELFAGKTKKSPMKREVGFEEPIVYNLG